MKKLISILLTVTAASAAFVFAGCPNEENKPEGTTTEITYHFVNGEDTFEFKKTQEKGSALSYGYSKVTHSDVWYSQADMQTEVTTASGDTMDVYTSFTDIEVNIMFRSENKTLLDLEQQTTVRAGATLPRELTQEGYIFAGWECDGKSYSAAETLDLENMGRDLIFTAKWNANSYSVTYINGEDKKTVTQDYSSAVAQAPEKTGYSFLGWYDGETKVEKITKEVTLTAKWQAHTYSISFDLGAYNGEFGYKDGDFEYSQVINLENLTLAGYKFSGWQIKAGAGEFKDINGSYTVGSDVDAKDIVIKAVFALNGYKVNVYGKDGSVSTVNLFFGDEYYSSLDEYAAEGFDGWYFDEAKTNLINFKDTVTADAADEFSVYGSFAGSTFTATLIAGEATTQITLPYGAALDNAEAEHGYAFAGWYEGDRLYTKMPLCDITLTALFNKQQFTLTYSDGSSAVPEPVTAEYLTKVTLAKPAQSGSFKTFVGWSYNGETYNAGDEIILNDNIQLVAVWDTYYIHVHLVDWDGYEIINGDFEAGWEISLPQGSVYYNAAEFAGFYNYDLFGRTVVYELGTQLLEDLDATAYYVNNSSNPATRGKQLTFMDAEDLFFVRSGYNYIVSGREWYYDGSSVSSTPYFIAKSLPANLNLPVTYKGALVTQVADGNMSSNGAFSVGASSTPYDYERYKVTGTVYIPSAYTRIGSYAFANQQAGTLEIGKNSKLQVLANNCGFLMTARAVYGFPANLRTVGSYAMNTGMYAAGKEDSFVIYDDEGQRITSLPESITYIGYASFRGCDVFETLDLSNVTYIGNLAFAGNDNIKNVIFGEKITSIPNQVFRNCNGITSVNIPVNIRSISSFAFAECSSLTSVTFELENSKLETIEPFAFFKSPLTKVILPDSVTEIGYGSFTYHFSSAVYTWSVNDDETSYITEIKLPANLKKIGSFAFAGAQIDSIEFPDKLEIIGAAAFMNTNIKKVEIPDSVVQIEDLAFAKLIKYAKTITKEDEFVLRIGKGITTLGGHTDEISVNAWPKGMVFRNFDNIVGIEFPEDSQLVTLTDFTFFNMHGLKGEIIFPSKVEYIGSDMFTFSTTGGSTGDPYWRWDPCEGADITRAFIPKTVTYVGSEAFAFCTKLTEVEFENNYEEGASLRLMYSLFRGCTGLKSITLPCQLVQLYAANLDQYAGVFSDCTSLEEVTFTGRGEHGEDLDCQIYSSTFWGCKALKRVYVFRSKKFEVVLNSRFYETEINHVFLKDCPNVQFIISKTLPNYNSLLTEYNTDAIWKNANGARIVASR